jgi:hypothetical protein
LKYLKVNKIFLSIKKDKNSILQNNICKALKKYYNYNLPMITSGDFIYF